MLAVLFWFVVVSLESTYVQFPDSVTVRAFNLGEQFALVNDLGRVKLTLRSASADMFKSMAAGDFEAYVDLAHVGTGEKKVPISVTSKNTNITIVRVEPAEISVVIEPLQKVQVPLSYRVTGNPAEGFAIDRIELDREYISIMGAESVLKKVKNATALVEFDGTEKSNFTSSVPVKVYDERDLPTSQVVVQDELVSARIFLAAKSVEKDVGVKVKFAGVLSNGFLKSTTVEPSVITVVGPPEIIETVEVIETEEVDLSLILETTTQSVALKIPVGASLKDKELLEVAVSLVIGSYTEAE